MAKRILAIGDVHGCFNALTTLLDSVSIFLEDTVVFLGDVIDRGPASKQVVERILSLREECDVVYIMGNHEEMMRNCISGHGLLSAWMDAGGQAMLDSYGGSIEDIPPEHVRFLATGSHFWETESEIFVHANLESNISLRNQATEFLRWKHLGGLEPPHISGKRVICGHTSQTDGVPLVLDGWVCIDTFPHGGKWLTCLDVSKNFVYQASENRDAREFPLEKFV